MTFEERVEITINDRINCLHLLLREIIMVERERACSCTYSDAADDHQHAKECIRSYPGLSLFRRYGVERCTFCILLSMK